MVLHGSEQFLRIFFGQLFLKLEIHSIGSCGFPQSRISKVFQRDPLLTSIIKISFGGIDAISKRQSGPQE